MATYEPPWPSLWDRNASVVTTTSVTTLPVSLPFYTWREAIMVATGLLHAREGRTTVRREGDRWVVRYRTRLYAVN